MLSDKALLLKELPTKSNDNNKKSMCITVCSVALNEKLQLCENDRKLLIVVGCTVNIAWTVGLVGPLRS